MTREEAKKIFPDATPEQLQQLMDLYGKGVNDAKKSVEDIKAQLAAKEAELKTALSKAAADDLKAMTDRATALEAELTTLKHANEVREIREKVASELKLPASLLTGETEDACKTQAAQILEFAKPGNYPALKDGGEVGGTGGKQATRDQFAEWFSQLY